jgi:hypothetical protein
MSKGNDVAVFTLAGDEVARADVGVHVWMAAVAD